ncbi:MAG TPA: crossover junction endodeoxyribonuclease RuvC [Methylothermaceae bacterium]|nr:crossover junction endodeoxyribonuclease RuvC [Methylothermaceae bacterium]
MKTRILGIDPGSRTTGFGVIDVEGGSMTMIAAGCVRSVADDFPSRLKIVYDGVLEVVAEYAPDEMAIEQVFVQKNVDSALKLGQARGAAICAGLSHDLPIHEYAARQVKQALVGKGGADKHQVQHMVKILLNIHGDLPLDASDALAVAMCHAHYRQTRQRLAMSAL